MILHKNQLHIWHTRLDIDSSKIASFDHLLSKDEKKRAQRFKFERDRHRFIVARGVLRTILSKYINKNPEQIEFIYNNYGKPFLPAASDGIYFNVSHSHEMAVYAIGLEEHIGIDIEYIQGNSELKNIAKRFFSDAEYQTLNTAPPDKITTRFFHLWTRKEAFIKAVGDGLSYPLKDFEVNFSETSPQIIKIQNDETLAKEWSLFSFSPKIGYTAALAVKTTKGVPIIKQLCYPLSIETLRSPIA